jgi:hypothetical protein
VGSESATTAFDWETDAASSMGATLTSENVGSGDESVIAPSGQSMGGAARVETALFAWLLSATPISSAEPSNAGTAITASVTLKGPPSDKVDGG